MQFENFVWEESGKRNVTAIEKKLVKEEEEKAYA